MIGGLDEWKRAKVGTCAYQLFGTLTPNTYRTCDEARLNQVHALHAAQFFFSLP